MAESESCFGCPNGNCNETPATCKNPCAACPMEHDCLNDNTDVRGYCVAFSKFLDETMRVTRGKK